MLSAKLNPSTGSHRQSSGASLKGGNWASKLPATIGMPIGCRTKKRYQLMGNVLGLQRRGVVFHQDNARPHTSVVTRQKLWELDWKVLMRPPYSPDLAPNDYRLFLALQNFQSDKNLGRRKDRENQLLEFFVYKGQDF
ncbi:histone-lysine N-methyltransferase SETMAR [Trichonephila clavipes]|nr:histone-lysine N-methyltransferase SETMAR [Trichonephila clavipes]